MKTFKTPKGTELPILDLRGKDYLEVKYRIVWFREEHPDWAIHTTILREDAKSALAQAKIINSSGMLMASAHKHETAQGFGDFIEKAETGAIGRALALIGYGTQFCADELDEGKRIVDSPISVNSPKLTITPKPVTPESVGEQIDASLTGVWTFSFGKWKGRSIDSIYTSPDPKEGREALLSYMNYLEQSAIKDNKPLSAAAQTAIHQIEFVIGTMENEAARLMKEDDIPF